LKKHKSDRSFFSAQHLELKQWTSWLLVKIADRTRNAFADSLKSLDIGPKHYGILFWLDRQGALSQVELGERTNVDRAPMVQFIDHLEKLELVERTQNPRDRRAHAIVLTDKGRDILQQATELASAVENQIFASLSPQEREQLNYLLNQVLINPASDNE
jgi:DNA-binding MarR family transcriptional regulator